MPSFFEAAAGSALGVVTAQTGSVTQATNKGTAVTLNNVAGAITMNNAALAAAAEVTFTVTNSKVSSGDVIQVNHGSAGTAGTYVVQANTIADGSFKISVGNVSGSSASEAIVLNFMIFKAG